VVPVVIDPFEPPDASVGGCVMLVAEIGGTGCRAPCVGPALATLSVEGTGAVTLKPVANVHFANVRPPAGVQLREEGDVDHQAGVAKWPGRSNDEEMVVVLVSGLPLALGVTFTVDDAGAVRVRGCRWRNVDRDGAGVGGERRRRSRWWWRQGGDTSIVAGRLSTKVEPCAFDRSD